LNFKKGDIQYINSLGLLHARDAFRDSEQHTSVLPQAPLICIHSALLCAQEASYSFMAAQRRVGLENARAIAAYLAAVVLRPSRRTAFPPRARNSQESQWNDQVEGECSKHSKGQDSARGVSRLDLSTQRESPAAPISILPEDSSVKKSQNENTEVLNLLYSSATSKCT
jgi:hypothetical protein